MLILSYMTDLVSQNIEVILNRKTNMEAVIKIIEENIPEVTLVQWQSFSPLKEAQALSTVAANKVMDHI